MKQWKPPTWTKEVEETYVSFVKQIPLQPKVFGSLQVVPFWHTHETIPFCTNEVLKVRDARYHWNPNNTSCGNKVVWWSPKRQAARCGKCVTASEKEMYYYDWRPYRLLLLATMLDQKLI